MCKNLSELTMFPKYSGYQPGVQQSNIKGIVLFSFCIGIAGTAFSAAFAQGPQTYPQQTPPPQVPQQQYPVQQQFPNQPALQFPPQGYPVRQPYQYPPGQAPYQQFPPQQPYPGQQQYPPGQPYPGQYPPPQQVYPPQQMPLQNPQQPYPNQQTPQFVPQGSVQPQQASQPPGKEKPDDGMAEFLKLQATGRQLISGGNPAFAVEPLDKAVKMRPRNLSIYFYRGLAYDEAGDPARAVKDYLESLDRAKTIGMDSADLRVNLGNSYMKLNYLNDAIAEYHKAIDIEPRCAPAYLALGRALLSKGDHGEAMKNFRRCEALGFTDPSLSYVKALALAAAGEKQEALGELAPLLSEDASTRTPQLHKAARELSQDLK